MSIYVPSGLDKAGNPVYVPVSAQFLKDAYGGLPTESVTAKIEVGTTSVALGNKHLNVLYTLENDSGESLTIVLRGGPSTSPDGLLKQIPALASGATGAMVGDPMSDSPFGDVVSTGGFHGPKGSEVSFNDNNYPTYGLDYEVGSPRITVAEGQATEMLPKLYQLIDAFSDIQDSQYKYNPIYSNSNSAAFTALEKSGIQPKLPLESGEEVSAPGATSNFDSGYITRQVVEDTRYVIKDIVDSLDKAADKVGENYSEFINETAEYIEDAFETDVNAPIPEDHYDIIIGSQGGQTIPLTEEDRAIFIGKNKMDLVDYSLVKGGKGVRVDLDASYTSMQDTPGIKDYLDEAIAHVTGTQYDDDLKGDDKPNVFNPGKGNNKVDGGDNLDTIQYTDNKYTEAQYEAYIANTYGSKGFGTDFGNPDAVFPREPINSVFDSKIVDLEKGVAHARYESKLAASGVE